MEDYSASEPNVFTIENNSYSKEGIAALRKIVEIEGDFEYDAAALEEV